MPRERPAKPSHAQPAFLRLTTPEGDPLSFVTAHYRHGDPQGIRLALSRASDFGEPDPGDAGEVLTFSWYETQRRPDTPAPIGQRILATLTLTPTGLNSGVIAPCRSLASSRSGLSRTACASIRLAPVKPGLEARPLAAFW